MKCFPCEKADRMAILDVEIRGLSSNARLEANVEKEEDAELGTASMRIFSHL